MSEEKIEYKVSVPLFEKGELETFDNHIHEIVEKYSKLVLKEKEQILTQRIIMKQEEEIERLNNIINEIENDLLDRYYGRGKYHLSTDIIGISTFLNRIKELKGSAKE